MVKMEKPDVEWELEEGIPQVNDPFIQQYLKGRSSLIEEEQKQRHGGNFPLLGFALRIGFKHRTTSSP